MCCIKVDLSICFVARKKWWPVMGMYEEIEVLVLISHWYLETPS